MKNQRLTTRMLIPALGLAVMFTGATNVFAQSHHNSGVNVSLSSHEAYVGVPIALRVEIANASKHGQPEIPEIDGVRVESLGTPSQSSQTTIINGHRTHKVSLTYAWKLTPHKAGRFVIPEFNVTVNGQQHQTKPLAFVATKSDTGDLLFAEVVGQQESVYVGESLPLKLRIWLKPFRDRRSGTTLSEADMWSFVSDDPTAFGVFADAIRDMNEKRQRPAGHEVLRTDSDGNEHAYYLYEIETSMYPRRPGDIEGASVQVVVSYPTGLGRSRDIFSMFDRGLQVTGTRPIVANAEVRNATVKAIPEKDRPADYRGAVGHYKIVTQALPTHVQAGDPITLHIGIHGDGPMDLLQCPPIWEVEEFTSAFKVPKEPPAGVVHDGVKLFSISIRPRREGVTVIPGVPMSYFAPDTESFVTARSEPIAIQVDKAQQLDLSAIVGQQGPDSADAGFSTDNRLSYINARGVELLKSDSKTALWPFVLVGVLGPLAFAGTWLTKRFSRSPTCQRLFQRGQTADSLREAILCAEKPEQVAKALLQFIANETHMESQSLTRQEAVRHLREVGRDDNVLEVDSVLSECERATYTGCHPFNVDWLAAAALKCISHFPPTSKTRSARNVQNVLPNPFADLEATAS